MRDLYNRIWRSFFKERAKEERMRMGLTQAEISDKLAMDLRSYSDLEHGYSSGGGLTVVLFLTRCCQNPMHFLEDADQAFERAEEDEYASV